LGSTPLIDEELIKRIIQLGADDYIMKLFRLDHIEKKFREKLIQRAVWAKLDRCISGKTAL